MTRLGIRAQLLLVLTVFLALPWLGVEYARELERVLRDAQDRTLAGTAQAVAIALHDRPRLFDAPVRLVAPTGQPPQDLVDAAAARPVLSAGAAVAAPELEQILQGLTRTTARIRIVDRDLGVLAHAGSLKRSAEAAGAGSWLDPVFALFVARPTEEFVDDDGSGSVPAHREIVAALDGIPATGRRTTDDARAVVVAAAHPIWVGDRVRGVVLVEETTNAVLAERNRAFERLFAIVVAILVVGSAALTLYATWLSARIRRLARDAEGAIDREGRVRGPLPGSDARDEIGDLARSYSGVLARLAGYASYREQARALHQGADRRNIDTECERDPDHSFVSHQPYLERLMLVDHGEQRHNRPAREVHVGDLRTGLVEHVAEDQRDGSETGKERKVGLAR